MSEQQKPLPDVLLEALQAMSARGTHDLVNEARIVNAVEQATAIVRRASAHTIKNIEFLLEEKRLGTDPDAALFALIWAENLYLGTMAGMLGDNPITKKIMRAQALSLAINSFTSGLQGEKKPHG